MLDRMRIGQNVKSCRKALNMTQAELAEKSGVSRSTISYIENGKERNLTFRTVNALTKALDTNPKIFFCPGHS